MTGDNMNKIEFTRLSNKQLKERYLMLRNSNNYFAKQELMKLSNYLVKNDLTEIVLC